eukprot:scaffold44580_cov20-Prasinocladus_malaysianus.AAC.1
MTGQGCLLPPLPAFPLLVHCCTMLVRCDYRVMLRVRTSVILAPVGKNAGTAGGACARRLAAASDSISSGTARRRNSRYDWCIANRLRCSWGCSFYLLYMSLCSGPSFTTRTKQILYRMARWLGVILVRVQDLTPFVR